MTAAEIKRLRSDFARSGGFARAKKLSRHQRIESARKAGIASGKARAVNHILKEANKAMSKLAKNLSKKQQTKQQTKQTNRAA